MGSQTTSSQTSRRGLLGSALGAAGLLALTACSPEPSSSGPEQSNGPDTSSATESAVETVPEQPQNTPDVSATTDAALDDPSSLSVIVNKRRPINPQNYAPTDLIAPALQNSASGQELLRAPAADAFTKLSAAATANGTPLIMLSGFRSYATQVTTYNSWVTSLGQANADASSARPGFSEHQTGLAVDIGDSGACNLRGCFATQPLAVWVSDHCHEFGFVVRYQPNQQNTTGFFAEPWHLRYLGTDLATAVVQSGAQTLEEYFGLPAAPDYL